MHSIVGFLIKNNVNSFLARTVCILKSCKYMNVPTSSMHTGWTLLLAVLLQDFKVYLCMFEVYTVRARIINYAY